MNSKQITIDFNRREIIIESPIKLDDLIDLMIEHNFDLDAYSLIPNKNNYSQLK